MPRKHQKGRKKNYNRQIRQAELVEITYLFEEIVSFNWKLIFSVLGEERQNVNPRIENLLPVPRETRTRIVELATVKVNRFSQRRKLGSVSILSRLNIVDLVVVSFATIFRCVLLFTVQF